ncbi:MAG: RIO1 family regulatory kinase/ATPase [Planctomycetota bacterium]
MVEGRIVIDGSQVLTELIEIVAQDPSQFEILRDARQDSVVVRALPRDAESVIVKLWRKPGTKSAIGRAIRVHSAYREWTALGCLHAAGIPVPRPLAILRLKAQVSGFTDAIAMDDLGECITAMQFIKQLVKAGRLDELSSLNDVIVDMTMRILATGIVDTDHSVVNMLVDRQERLHRIDLELARRLPVISMFDHRKGRMVGKLLSSYVFAVQPDVMLIDAFVDLVLCRMDLPASVSAEALGYVRTALECQRRLYGIDVRASSIRS